MRKCPKCGEKTIKVINQTFLSQTKTIECTSCKTKSGKSKQWTSVVNRVYFVVMIILMIIMIPLNSYMLQFGVIFVASTIVMVVVELFFIPYEVREEKV